MKIIVDQDVAKVAEFIERNVPAEKMRRVSIALVQLAELLWARYEMPTYEVFRPFEIYREQGPHISHCDVAESPQQLGETPVSQTDSLASAATASVHHAPHTVD